MQDKYPNEKVYALFIALMSDEATSNTTRNRSQCPVSFLILNFKGKHCRPYLLGHSPIPCPYTTQELHDMLNKQGITNCLY